MSNNIKEDFGVGPGSVMTTQSGIAGLPPDIPPVNKSPNIVRRKSPKFLKREPHSRFGGKAVFRVDPKTYYECYLGKLKGQHYETLLKDSSVFEEIRDYGRLNWKEPIILQNEVTGAMVYLKYGGSTNESMGQFTRALSRKDPYGSVLPPERSRPEKLSVQLRDKLKSFLRTMKVHHKRIAENKDCGCDKPKTMKSLRKDLDKSSKE